LRKARTAGLSELACLMLETWNHLLEWLGEAALLRSNCS